MKIDKPTKMFDSQGKLIYFYEIYGYEHSTMYWSSQEVSQSEIDELIHRCLLAQKRAKELLLAFDSRPDIEALWNRMSEGDNIAWEEYDKIYTEEGIAEQLNKIEGNHIEQQLNERFEMHRIVPLKKGFKDCY